MGGAATFNNTPRRLACRMTEADSIVGARLAAERHRRGMTQKTVAEYIGTSPSRVSLIENGMVQLRLVDVIEYCNVVRAPLANMLTGLERV